jgi:hypothetical protein
MLYLCHGCLCPSVVCSCSVCAALKFLIFILRSTSSLTGGRPAPRLLGQRPAYGLNQTTRQSKLMLNCLLNMVFGGSNNDDVKVRNPNCFYSLFFRDV